MKITDIKEQKIMSTEIKKLNLAIKLLIIIVILLLSIIVLQITLILNFINQKSVCITKYDIQQVSNEVTEVKKKVNFRYFNLTHSLEDIYNVKINTENGRVIKQ